MALIASEKQQDMDLAKRVSFYFPDNEKLWFTAYADFRTFLQAGSIETGGGFRIIADRAATECFEAYQLEVKIKKVATWTQ